MHPRTLALVFATAVIGTGCVSNETKPDASPAATSSSTTSAAPVAAPPAEPAPVASKPECAPEPKTKAKKETKKETKPKGKNKPEVVAVDCEPAKPKSVAPTSKASPASATPVAATPVATAPAATPTKEAEKPADPGKPKIVKSRDGTFEGEVYGNIPANSKWAKLQIGMEQPEVERLLGVSTDVHSYPTAKAFIPFYYGTDRYRYEVRYRGQGSVSYTGGSWGAGAGIVMMINYDPKM